MQIVINSPNKTCFGNSYGGMYNYCVTIYADINGKNEPNRFGRDVFGFELKDDGLYPRGCDEDGWCNGSKSKKGWDCTCKVLTEGEMNY